MWCETGGQVVRGHLRGEGCRGPSIPARPGPDLVPLPPRFRVRIRKRRLVGMVPGTSSRIGVTPTARGPDGYRCAMGIPGVVRRPGLGQHVAGLSEIVRPTRDGIHGREYIATTVELGARPAFPRFDRERPALTRARLNGRAIP